MILLGSIAVRKFPACLIPPSKQSTSTVGSHDVTTSILRYFDTCACTNTTSLRSSIRSELYVVPSQAIVWPNNLVLGASSLRGQAMHEPDKPLLPGVDRLDWQANDVFRSSSLLVEFSTESSIRRAREPNDKGTFNMTVITITYESFQPNLTKILCRDVKTIIIPLSNGYLMKVAQSTQLDKIQCH